MDTLEISNRTVTAELSPQTDLRLSVVNISAIGIEAGPNQAGLNVGGQFGVVSLWAVYFICCVAILFTPVLFAFMAPAVGVPFLLMVAGALAIGANTVVRPMIWAFQKTSFISA